MNAAELLDKKLREAGLPVSTVRTSAGSLQPVFSRDLTVEELAIVDSLTALALNEVRIEGIYTAAQAAKNASLGKTPEEMAETLKLQVNMGFGGLLLLNKQLVNALGTLLIGSNVCSAEQFTAALQSALTEAEHAAVEIRTRYWNWIAQVDAEALAAIAENRAPVFPDPPTLN